MNQVAQREIFRPQVENLNPAECIDLRHLNWLLDVLRKGDFESTLEIGCADGVSSSAFFEAMRLGATFESHFCDVQFRPGFQNMLRTVPPGPVIKLHQTSSAELMSILPDPPFDFVFVDGDHSVAAVSREVEWLLTVRPRVIMAHDTTCWIRGAAFSWCDGPPFLKWALQAAGYHILEDSHCRPGELTDRGMLAAARDGSDYQVILSGFRDWCGLDSLVWS